MKFEGTKIVYEIGDWITYEIKPNQWSSAFTEKCPFDIEKYPVTFQIEKIEDGRGMLGMGYGWSVSPITGRPATQQEIDKAVREVKDELKVGDWVYLLEDMYGFCKGDVGAIVSIDKTWYMIYVQGRVSSSGYAPNVAYTKDGVRRATPEEIAKAKEPVRFNKGDWVTCIELAEGVRQGSGWELGLTFQITRVEKYSDGDIYFGGRGSNGVYIQSIRMATAKEIQNAKDKVIKIGDHKTVIDGGVLVVGCKSFSRSQVSDLYRVMRDLQINAIKIEGTEVRFNVVTKIYDRMCS